MEEERGLYVKKTELMLPPLTYLLGKRSFVKIISVRGLYYLSLMSSLNPYK